MKNTNNYFLPLTSVDAVSGVFSFHGAKVHRKSETDYFACFAFFVIRNI